MNHTTYIQNLFYSFLQKTDNISGNMMFIKHYNTVHFNKEYIEETVGSVYKDDLFYHSFNSGDIKEPYEPFLNGIKHFYHRFYQFEMSVKDFIDKCEVYSLHKELFISYMSEGVVNRKEAIVVSETTFEMGKFAESIINSYNFIAKKVNVLLFINNIQYCSLSTLNIIKKLMDDPQSCNMKLMVIYNEAHQSVSYVNKELEKITNLADDKGILFEWESDVIIKEYVDKHFLPDTKYFKEHLRKINNLVNTLALDDAEYYINVIHNRIVEDKVKVNKEDRFLLYFHAAFCYILKKDFNNALFMSERLTSLYDKNKDLLCDYQYNYICYQLQMLLTQSELTEKYASKCIELAKKIGDEELIFNAEVLYQGAQFGGWRNVFSIDFSKVEIKEDMIDKLRKYNYLNTLAYYLIFGFDNDDETIKKMAGGVMSETYKEAIRLGKYIGNTCFLLSAYTKYIIMFSERGYYKSLFSFYDEKYKIISKEHNESRKAHMLMGMGYSSMVAEEYAKANNSLMEAVDILYKVKNPEEIAEALYNMAQNCICAEDYLSAVSYMNTVFKILDNLGMQTIQICNVTKLYALLSLAYYKSGNEYKCYKVLGNVKLNVAILLNNETEEEQVDIQLSEELFLYYMLTAILEKNSGDYVSANENFSNARRYFERCQTTAFYSVVTFISEYYAYYMRLGKKEEAFEILDYGRDYCNRNGYMIKSKRLLYIAEKKNVAINGLPSDFGSITLDDMIALAYSRGKENQLMESKKDIRFMSMWQEMLNRDDLDYNETINNGLKTLQKNFNLDELLFLEVNDGKASVIYKDLSGDVDFNQVVLTFTHTRREFIANRNSKTFSHYNDITSLFDSDNIMTFVGIPVYNENSISAIFIGIVNRHKNFRHNRIIMDEERLMIMKTAIIQLNNGIERIISKNNIIEMNKKLNELAVTDMLTGLYNRQGLTKQLEQYSNCSDMISILYADLDNFKYYNDTFGHDVGDVILKEFSKVISEVAKNIGYAVRYGGDEFLIILNNIKKEEARKVAEHIYEAISDGFVPVVSEYLHKDVTIPKHKLVSCSIGIAFSEDGSMEHINEALKNADKALYYMKKRTKGNYVVWEDIHEEE
ncbi:MAG: GGDEF domain-containing protein [Lachnospiraceae bacterium]|nr:GGDEF domain-containing protein [Lachnospiraceae bacterium]